MLKKIARYFGYNEYSVTYTVYDSNNRYVGMLSIVCTAKTKRKAMSKAQKTLLSNQVLLVGTWKIKAEII